MSNNYIRAWKYFGEFVEYVLTPWSQTTWDEKSHRIRRWFCEHKSVHGEQIGSTLNGVWYAIHLTIGTELQMRAWHTHTLFAWAKDICIHMPTCLGHEATILKVLWDRLSPPSIGFRGKSKLLPTLPCMTSPFFSLKHYFFRCILSLLVRLMAFHVAWQPDCLLWMTLYVWPQMDKRCSYSFIILAVITRTWAWEVVKGTFYCLNPLPPCI